MALSRSPLRSMIGNMSTESPHILDVEVNGLRSDTYSPQLTYRGVRDFGGFITLIRRMLSDSKTHPSTTSTRSFLL
ncbi:hypothetical protein DL93DRAFT_2073263 [Clavulina sp. PMI_390]|nr:hypothetical protein DL93DRAFT_2073263 [Clavulina sp. PMI_390]